VKLNLNNYVFDAFDEINKNFFSADFAKIAVKFSAHLLINNIFYKLIKKNFQVFFLSISKKKILKLRKS
jgi:hypothetical protein